MLLRTIAFLLGIVTLTFQSELSSMALIVSFILFIPLLLFKKPLITLILWFFGGFIWATVIAHQLLNNKIVPELEGQDIVVKGIISSLPEKIGRRTRFEFTIKSVLYNNIKYSTPKKIKLNWYGSAPKLIPDDYWQLLVRLKKPFSYQNSGGFDYEAWMFQNEIDAKGYVRNSKKNILLQANYSFFSFNQIRYNLKRNIKKINQSSYRSIILALLIGDKSEITDTQWSVFRKTGTSHLIAISGLHIGLIAGLVFFISSWLWRFSGTAVNFIPSAKLAAILAMLAAVIYSAMAGFSIPTQRALIMLCVVMISILIDVRAGSWKTLAIALLVVLLLSPFAVLNPGFWLSFFAVAIIIYFAKNLSNTVNKPISTLYNWSRVQLVIAVGLMPFVLLFFSESSIISPIANFIVVPIFSFFIVPAIFFAACILMIFPAISSVIFDVVIFVLDKIWIFLEYLAELKFSTIQVNHISLPVFLFFCVAILLLFLPKKFPAKWIAPLFLLPLIFNKAQVPDFGTANITLLDVGQGLSVVIQTKEHVLVYDTGTRFSKSFNTGDTVIIPYLKSKGLSEIDVLMISHGDNDHIGGVNSVVSTINVSKILTSVPAKVKSKIAHQNKKIPIDFCNSDNEWHWDGVDFKIIHPKANSTLRKNNASCVIQISTANSKIKNSILLTGDIESKAERQIIKNKSLDLRSTILIAPHHGSKTSSTAAFINKINPDYVLYPVGYRNRYRFPSNLVSKRYKDRGVVEYSTSEFGSITFILEPQLLKKPELYRVSQRRFWHN
ncbi:DNA internalization-related competence protein ComEC/Rec2 [hydrothermal vent metagenome]|uniref:DNA internalization-related competence protein ComEC/Rec2 n=1 Tax=hydrothermal vent metagenome TaxID=652676 RepID=A0A3B1AGV7_9ZZZZ